MIETQDDYQYEPPAVPLSLLAQVCEALEATKAERQKLEQQLEELQAQIDALTKAIPSVTDLATQENSKDF